MRAVIYCFSGTGNTRRAAEEFAREFDANGVETDIVDITSATPAPLVEGYDLVGIAYPIHAFNAPKIVLEFADKLPKTRDKRLFIVKTSGEPLKLNNISSIKLMSKLKRKGYSLTNEYHYAMPYNMIFRHSDAMAHKMWRTMTGLAKVEAREVLEGVPHKLTYIPFGRVIAWLFRIEHIALEINGKLYKVDGDKCVQCGLCVKNCPTQNITLTNGRFEFGGNCVCCTRCSFNCPTDAFNIRLVNPWRINGKYNMESDGSDDGSHKRYCRRAYARYFREAEEKTRSIT